MAVGGAQIRKNCLKMISEPELWLSPQRVLGELGLRPLRQLGQNFMVDRGVLRSICQKADLSPGEAVVEIGPGTGALSQYLLAQGVELLCVELDRGLAGYLGEAYKEKGLALVHGDILAKKTSIHKDVLEWAEGRAKAGVKPKWISNLPYNILTPFLWNLLKVPHLWSSGVFLVQKEFIDRLKAMPGDPNYGPLSVMSHLHLEVEMVRKVAKGCFWPAPDVESAVLAVRPLPGEIFEHDRFVDFLKRAFSQRRKVMSKVLNDWVQKDRLRDELESMGLAADVRAEKLSPEELLQLFKKLIQT